VKVFTRYPALAPAIKRAGYEPVLEEPLVYVDGPVKMKHLNGGLVVVHPSAPAIIFTLDTNTWTVLP
jgi:hypothetical protein